MQSTVNHFIFASDLFLEIHEKNEFAKINRRENVNIDTGYIVLALSGFSVSEK